MTKPIPPQGLTEEQRHRMIDLAASYPLSPKPVDAELIEMGLVAKYDEDGPEVAPNWKNKEIYDEDSGHYTPRFNWLVYRERCQRCLEIKRMESNLDYLAKQDAEAGRTDDSDAYREEKRVLDAARKEQCVCGPAGNVNFQ